MNDKWSKQNYDDEDCFTETIETAGCYGQCQSFTVDDLPDCKNCKEFKKSNE